MSNILITEGLNALVEQWSFKRWKNFSLANRGAGTRGHGSIPRGEVSSRRSNVYDIRTGRPVDDRAAMMLPGAYRYGYKPPQGIAKGPKSPKSLIGGTIAAAGSVVADVFTGGADELVIDKLVSSGRGDGAAEVAKRQENMANYLRAIEIGPGVRAKANTDILRRVEKEQQRRRRSSKELTIYLTVSLAAILAAGLTINQARKTIRRIRDNLQTKKSSLDIIKLASMGNVKGAEAVLKKEFNKTGVDLDRISAALEGASESDMKLAAKILRQELDL